MTYQQGDLTYNQNTGMFVLPHSCDDWVVGNLDDLWNLIQDALTLSQQHPRRDVTLYMGYREDGP